ncbi:MAG TPA: T9SS type A sorting domain-containing protein [Hymenobacter sp.]|uniref:T9SS type A sorting domain-containing protein n=1 Tax=Hymenobacter sp. TaxID=1898978 RepID=UPI002D7E657C|nr:T9SS type A sorting domain-containing protein [Hymenobacter sp.]HET9503660.1 T9SS type A sorting domain-containing protein [Hymenobacter sp.]
MQNLKLVGTAATTPTSPTLTTAAASSLTATSATLNGNLSSFGAPTGSSPAYGFVYSVASANAAPALGGAGTTPLTTGTAAATGAFSSPATGLLANTLYAAQAYATNGTGTGYGGVVSFTTLANVSSTTDAAPGQTTAAPGGTVAADGGAAISERGVYYSTTSGFVPPAGTKVVASAATGAGSFTSALTGLAAGTTYYVVAYATNAGGTSYGAEVSFTTAAATAAPTVSTISANATGQTTATATGNVSSEGSAGVTERGVYYGTTSGSVATTGTKIVAGAPTGAGTFTSALTGLAGLTTYYVVAYATNAVGTSYGTEVSFTTNGTATLMASPATLSLGTTAVNTPGAIVTYSLGGAGLTGSVTVTPPAGVEVSTDGFLTAANSSTASLTLTPADVAAGATISVRLAAGAAGTITNQNITNATAGAVTQNVAVSGTVAAGSSACVAENFNSFTGTASSTTQPGFATVGLSNYTSTGSSGAAPNAVQFINNNSSLTTPTVANPQQLQFYIKGNSVSGSSLLVEGLTNGVATTIDNITSFPTSSGTAANTKTYTAAMGIQSSFTNFRFTFSKVSGNVAFDDLVVTCGASAPLTVATGAPGVAGPYCVGQSPAGDVALAVPFTVTNGSFAAGNVFTAYLSRDGFATKTAIGTLSGVGSGTISAIIQQASGLVTAGNYRIRVEGSTTAATLADNGTDLSVASYLDNEVASATATSGNTQATLTFAAPAACATNVVVTVKAGTSVGTAAKPQVGGSYAPGASTSTGAVVFGTGTDLGGGQYVVYNGPASGSITVTGLTNGTRYAFGVFTTNGGASGATGYSNGTSRSVVPVAPAIVTELVVPQYLSGHASGSTTHSTRLPYVWRATLSSLQPSTTYKYYPAVRLATEPTNAAGAGNPIDLKTAGAFVRKTTSGLDNNSFTFTTDASGSYTGWFGLEPTGDARFTDQAVVYPMVVLNGGDGGNVATQFLATSSPVTVLQLNASATGATGVRGNSFGTPGNLVLTYDNPAGTGRPLAGTWLESDGLTASSYPSFYNTANVDGVAGAYGLLTPNANASGIQRVEQRALADGSLVGCAATSATGAWATANTASPSGGTTALVLSSGDTPFAAPTLTATSSTSIYPGQTLTLTGTGFATAPNAQVVFAPGSTVAAATVNAAGTSLTVVVPSGAGNGTIAVANGCGTSATLATTVPPPSAPGILLVEDDFDYPAGSLLTSNGWTGSGSGSTSNTMTVADNETAANYPKGAALGSLPAGTSSRARILGENTSNGIIYRSFGTPPSGATALYAAAVINFSSVENVSGSNYLLAFRTSGTLSYRGQVQVARVSGNPAAFTVALRGSGSFIASPTEFAVGTPYVLVLKTENSAATNNTDVYSLYLLPASADLSQEPTTPLLTAAGGSFFSTTTAFCIRQGDSNNPNAYLDGVRVATGWGAAVGNPVYTAASATIAAGNYNSLTLDNASTLTPIGGVNVESQLTLTSGTINTTATNSLTLYPAVAVTPAVASSTSGYVNGPVLRPVPALSGAQSFVFPVGSGGNYRPLTLNVAAQASPATYTATQTEGNAGQSFSNGNGLGAAPLVRVSAQRYYSVTTSNAGSGFSGTVTLTFAPNDYVNAPANAGLVVAKRDAQAADPNDDNKWTNLGSSAHSGTGTGASPVSGSLTSAVFTSFSDFTLGATNADPSINPLSSSASGPLPVQLVSFAAARQGSGVRVTWATASEKNSDYFVVERSLDGHTFARVARVAAQGTTAQGHAYASLDGAAPAARLYYRLRQVDLDGTVAYSPVVTVAAADAATAELILAPNPARESVSFETPTPTAYGVRNALGQLLRSGTTVAGPNRLPVQELPAGVYFLELHGAAGRVVRKFVKE